MNRRGHGTGSTGPAPREAAERWQGNFGILFGAGVGEDLGSLSTVIFNQSYIQVSGFVQACALPLIYEDP